MNTRRLVILVIALCCAGIAWVWYFGVRTKNATQIRKAVSTGVRIGDSLPQVLAMLERQQIEHSTPTKVQPNDSLFRQYGSGGPIIRAIVRNTKTSFVWSEDLQMIFVFDDNVRLKKVDIFAARRTL